MKITLFACAVVTAFTATVVSAEDPEVIPINEGQLIVCSDLATTQTMYALVADNRVQHVEGCWVVDAPMQVIVLQDGPRISNITYRQFRGEDVIAQMIENGLSEDSEIVQRVRDHPWTEWYARPAWAFTAWLQPSE